MQVLPLAEALRQDEFFTYAEHRVIMRTRALCEAQAALAEALAS